MRQLFIKRKISALCHIWQGVFLILIFSSAAAVFGKPAVRLLVGTNSNNHHITVVGTSVEGFKNGIIECEYESSINIDDALLGSPISAVALSASIDRPNHQLHIAVSATKQISIDSASIITLEIPLSSITPFSVLKILSATFTNQSGVSQTADIRSSLSVGITQHPLRNKKVVAKPDQFFQFNGRTVSQATMKNFKLRPYSGLTISQRVISK